MRDGFHRRPPPALLPLHVGQELRSRIMPGVRTSIRDLGMRHQFLQTVGDLNRYAVPAYIQNP